MKQPILTNYICPLCDAQLISVEGCPQLPEFGGVSLYCPSLKCPAQECLGHGRTIGRAYEIILSKYAGKKNTELTED